MSLDERESMKLCPVCEKRIWLNLSEHVIQDGQEVHAGCADPDVEHE